VGLTIFIADFWIGLAPATDSTGYYWPIADVNFAETENTGHGVYGGEGELAFHFFNGQFHDLGTTRKSRIVCQANLDRISWTE